MTKEFKRIPGCEIKEEEKKLPQGRFEPGPKQVEKVKKFFLPLLQRFFIITACNLQARTFKFDHFVPKTIAYTYKMLKDA